MAPKPSCWDSRKGIREKFNIEKFAIEKFYIDLAKPTRKNAGQRIIAH